MLPSAVSRDGRRFRRLLFLHAFLYAPGVRSLPPGNISRTDYRVTRHRYLHGHVAGRTNFLHGLGHGRCTEISFRNDGMPVVYERIRDELFGKF